MNNTETTMKECSTCTINYDGKMFYPLRGNPITSKNWNTKCCQYAKKKGKSCINPCNEVNTTMMQW